MKKRYFAPEMEIVEISSNISLLAGSNLDVMNGVDFDDAVPGVNLDADTPPIFNSIDISFME